MKNKKVISTLIACILITGLIAVSMYSRKVENTIQTFNAAETQQCIWGN